MTKPVQFPAARKPVEFWRGKRFIHASALASCDYISGPAEDSVSFTSVCLMCFGEQPQHRYSRAVLASCLERGHTIQAYCAACDEFWDVSPRERAELATALARSAARG